jgi:uncharacterized repeat protein (TIGR03803 family)
MELKWKAGNIVFLSLISSAVTAIACAGTITFDVSGTMTDGAVLSGAMTVDEIEGTVTALSFTLGAPDSLTASVRQYDGGITSGNNTWLVEAGVTSANYPSLSLVLPASTLVGYKGGRICSSSAPCANLASGLLLPPSGQGPFLQSGSVVAQPTKTFTTLHSFDGADGGSPAAALVQATNGDLYGTTVGGGANDSCAPFTFAVGCGTVFKITPGGALTTLHSFNSADGSFPNAVIQAMNGDLYGTTIYGGSIANCSLGCGTVFKMTPSGTLTTLHSFCAQSIARTVTPRRLN